LPRGPSYGGGQTIRPDLVTEACRPCNDSVPIRIGLQLIVIGPRPTAASESAPVSANSRTARQRKAGRVERSQERVERAPSDGEEAGAARRAVQRSEPEAMSPNLFDAGDALAGERERRKRAAEVSAHRHRNRITSHLDPTQRPGHQIPAGPPRIEKSAGRGKLVLAVVQ
jgi:hypothetical protein